MTATYQTKDGDVLDDIVNRYYGDTNNGIVETVLEANTGLADYGPILPAGLSIALPERPAVSKQTLVRLWD